MNYSDNVDFFICTSMRLICKPSKKVTGFLSLIEFLYSYFFQEFCSYKIQDKRAPRIYEEKKVSSPQLLHPIFCAS
jgi:hypothetical protein